jgi:hypothetical protein
MTDMAGHKGTRLTLTLFKAQTGHVKNSSIWFKYRRHIQGFSACQSGDTESWKLEAQKGE